MMEDQELDRILSEEEILPSAGFTASVMQAVHSEAAAPPPIPFPWKRAFLGIAAAALTLTWVFVAFVQVVRAPVSSAAAPAWSSFDSIPPAWSFGGTWTLLALLLSYACVKLSMSFGVRRV
jgi:hypothetical protein